MDTLNIAFAGMFAALAAIFALGLTPQFSRRFYPESPGFFARLAAPVIFALLAMGSYWRMAIPSLVTIAVLGAIQMARRHWRSRIKRS
ncbi:hypothetical protein CCAX7_27650 [Capsulimonas corticalis]|uniref:Uncharacterized protein n=2 Tax=Capsulimonas corticalis TaxID=2219043 RepID=A0A402CTI6_9BACT|nr:hypothetical protein CCAX7_27650 [Capsulimonas corticalis]